MIRHLQDLVRRLKARRRARRTPEEVFSRIYRTNRWGGEPGEFYSGAGTRMPEIRDPYVHAIEGLARELEFGNRTAVDLGCGDFDVGRRIAGLFRSYVGVDVVPDLIRHNQAAYGSHGIRFVHADLTADELPVGDVCFVRQVFQHLSNEQIARALPKLTAFTHVIVSEHIADEASAERMNEDHIHGTSTRVERGSGVELTLPPFHADAASARVLLEVPVPTRQGGFIRTTLFSPLRTRRVPG